MLTFEVVDFSELYHVILGWSCYVKFMAIPSYAYLKLKISGFASIITVEAKAQWALDYKQRTIELTAAAVAAVELKELCHNTQPSSSNLAMPSMTYTFKATGDVKAVQVNVEDPAKTI
jgi:hypothetical protein